MRQGGGSVAKLKDFFGAVRFRLAYTSLKSVEVPPWPPPQDPTSRGGGMLFALTFFLIHQISSEKLQNFANTLKILCNIFGDSSYDDAWFRKSFFKKIMSRFWQDFQDIVFEKKSKKLIYTTRWSKKLFWTRPNNQESYMIELNNCLSKIIFWIPHFILSQQVLTI